MSTKNIVLSPSQYINRMAEGTKQAFYHSYKNPWLLATLYYTEGLSTVEMAHSLGCEQRTIRRYMNYYGLRRFTKQFSLLVKFHGIEEALKMQTPEYYPLGVHND